MTSDKDQPTPAVRPPSLDQAGETGACLCEGLVLLDRDRRLIFVSDGVSGVLGEKPARGSELSFLRGLPWSGEHDLKALEVLLAGDPGEAGPLSCTLRQDAVSGGQRLVRLKLEQAGEGLLLTCRELGGEHALASQARENRDLYRGLVEGLPLGVLLLRGERIAFANPMAARRLGFAEPHDLLGLDAFRFVAPEHRDRLRRLMEARLAGEADLPEAHEAELLSAGGERFPAEIRAKKLSFAGRPAVQLVVTDISEARQARLALEEARDALEDRVARRTEALSAANQRLELALADQRQSETRYRQLVESIGDVIYRVDAAGRIEFISPALTRLTGFEPAAFLGSNFNELVHPDDRRRLAASFKRAFEGEPGQAAFRLAKKDGDWVHVMANNRLEVRDGRPVALNGAISDVSRLRAVEDRLREAKEAAEAASRAKSEFLANMSHEIRTPMNGILGAVELLEGTSLSETQREYLRMMRTSGSLLLRTINDILDFSKGEAGKLELSPVEFDPRGLLGDLLKVQGGAAEAKGLELVGSVDAQVPRTLMGDPDRLAQILGNLVGNALKFTAAGEVIITLEVEDLSADEAFLRFAVADTGIGLSREEQVKVFEAFQQADGGTTRRYGGSGLGLAICAQLVDLMGGKMWLDSEPGAGSIFHFWARFGLTPAGASPPAPELAGRRALVVDDSTAASRAVATYWASMGGESARAGSAEGALRLWPDGTFWDLALVDGDMLGQAAGQRLARRAAEQGVPLVALRPPGRHDSAGQPAVAASVNKPVSYHDLLTVARSVLESGPPERNRAPSPARAAQPRRANLLVAEDNPVNQRVALAMLERLGHRVTLAGNGLEAVEAAAREPFDLVLMDLQMPVMDGLAATDGIRRQEAGGRRTPIVALTAHALAGDRERCLEAGMDDYLSKPLTMSALSQTLARWLDGAPAPDRSPAARREAAGPAPDRVPGDLDLERARERFQGHPTLMHQMMSLFHEEWPVQLARLRRAMAAGDRQELARAAHSLKGALAYFDGGALLEILVRLEAPGESWDPLGAAGEVERLYLGLRRLTGQMAAYLANLEPG